MAFSLKTLNNRRKTSYDYVKVVEGKNKSRVKVEENSITAPDIKNYSHNRTKNFI